MTDELTSTVGKGPWRVTVNAAGVIVGMECWQMYGGQGGEYTDNVPNYAYACLNAIPLQAKLDAIRALMYEAENCDGDPFGSGCYVGTLNHAIKEILGPTGDRADEGCD